MNTFKKNSLYLAVAGASALAAGSAQAVALNADVSHHVVGHGPVDPGQNVLRGVVQRVVEINQPETGHVGFSVSGMVA